MKYFRFALVAVFFLALTTLVVHAQRPVAFGSLYYNGNVVRTVVPPAAFPKKGRDPFYKVTNGVDGQLGIAGVAPGSPGYHGGHWAVNLVTFNEGVTPYLLTSADAVKTAESAGDVTVTRTPENDFLCPIQP